MGRIRVLPPALVNRIAAGECVERPASVVKELAENALDAGATRIEIAIVEGGRELIRVRDDGGGMQAEDLALSVISHATSKISADDDLFRIHTLGFRGEALASIGSVSRLRITSRMPGVDSGHVLSVEAGEVRGPEPASAAPGTTVEVRDLFYNVPVRRKFLRTNQTEMGHITEQVTRLALAHPEVTFSLMHQNRSSLHLIGGESTLKRISELFGPELADVLLPIERAGGGVHVAGHVAPPAESRGSGKWEYLFVNGRFVRDRFVSHAVKAAYRSLIDPQRFPVTFLFLTLDPALVDVNVHPTKIEVRWRDSNYVHGQVLAALRERFISTNLDRALRTPREEDDYRERVRSAMVDYFTHARPTAPAPLRPAGVFAPGGSDSPRSGAPELHDAAYVPTSGQTPSGALSTLAVDLMVSRRDTDPGAGAGGGGVAGERAASLADAGDAAPLRVVQVHNTYLVAETPDGLMIVDQHALHERILYEELLSRVTSRTLESQRLLLPLVVRVPADRVEALESQSSVLARLGIELAASGPQTVTLHAFPSLLFERVDPAAFVADLLDLLGEQGARPDAEILLHRVLDMMACKAAVKAGDPLSADEIAALLARRSLAERSSNCPHGRPTTLRLTLRDLERQFKRT